MFSASKSGKVAGALAYDPQFNYVTALLHGDGTNGAQNNTFIDSSSNAYAITRNGTPTQGSFSPYGSNWSANLPATVVGSLQFDRLGTTSSFNFMHNASALWTLEVWVNLSALPASSFPIFSNNDFSSSGIGTTVSINSSGQVGLFITNGTAGSPVCSNTFTTTSIATNTWTYIALVYNQSLSSGNALLFINGVASGSANKTGNSPSTSNASLAAELFSYATGGTSYAFNGYASNLRITNSAVYSSAFTPSTTPLTAIANTQLLTFQSNRFVDNSTNAYAIVPHTTQSIQRFNPFLPTSSQAYSTSVYGGSGYFNGSTDYLTAPSSSSYAFGTTGTIEAWVYLTAYNTSQRICDINSNGNTLDVYITTSGFVGAFGGNFIATTGSIPLNTWNHVAVVVNSGTGKIYVNGVSQTLSGTPTGQNINATGTLYIGNLSSYTTYIFSGYMEDFRVTNTAVYSTNFTPPTAPLTAISGTVILLNYVNAGIYDNSMMNDWLTAGTAQISTSVKKYGTGSLSFSGASTSYLSTPTNSIFNFGTGNFTIEFWVYFNLTSKQGVFGQINSSLTASSESVTMSTNSSGQLVAECASSSTQYDITSSALSTSTWYHIAYVRNNSTLTLYVNGTSAGTATISTNSVNSATTPFTIGRCGDYTTDYFLNGYIDDLRITKGYARYTSNFTPPTTALPNYGS